MSPSKLPFETKKDTNNSVNTPIDKEGKNTVLMGAQTVSAYFIRIKNINRVSTDEKLLHWSIASIKFFS